MKYGNYLIEKNGTITNLKTNKIIKPTLNQNGYYQVYLYNTKTEYWLLHRLLATLFIPNPQNKPCVGHWDCDKSNNSVENLYWCTYEENNNHPITLLRKSQSLKGHIGWNKGKHLTEETKKKISKTNSIPIIQYNDNGFEKKWEGINIASRTLGFSAGNISACCRGERNTHKGYKWRFK